jgi:hypothetical protein
MRALPLLLLALTLAGPAHARRQHAPQKVTDETACNQAIAAAERARAMPARVLDTIAQVESGRPIGPKLIPWPWAINADGVGHFYASKAEAIAAVQALQASGTRSIDVGCMQINLAAHPAAFASLDAAFDPATNARYAAAFLRVLTRQTGRIADAMTAYHSHTPEFAADYARRLLAIWPGAAALGLTDPAAPSDPAAPVSDPSGLLNPAFVHQIEQDRANLRRPFAAVAASRVNLHSVRGAGWPKPARQTTLVSR